MTIQLFGYATSPYVRKVGCYLHYKALDFEFVPVNPVAPEETIGFTGGTQVPVLRIDGEWRRESSQLGVWLDERYPDRPLLGRTPTERDHILGIDRWIDDQVIPGLVFRITRDGPLTLDFRFRAWRLAALLSAHTPLPEAVRNRWAEVIRSAPFIDRIVDGLDQTESVPDMLARLYTELHTHLGNGPFLGGMSAPSLADLSLFPIVTFGYQVGLADTLPFGDDARLNGWLERVTGQLPENPLLVPDDMIIAHLPWPPRKPAQG